MMRGRLPKIPLLLLILSLFPAHIAISQTKNPCRDCPLPGARSARDTVMDVSFADRTVTHNVLSAKRATRPLFGRWEQLVALKPARGNSCADTIVPVRNIASFSFGSIGIGGQTLAMPVLPAREFIRDDVPPDIPANFLEFTGNIGFAGADESARRIGVTDLYFGGEALVAPFGNMLGDDLAFALGAGVLAENKRLRIPVIAHLRYTFLGSPRIEERSRYLPDACSFGLPGDAPLPAPGGYTELAGGERDSTVQLLHEKALVRDDFRPFLFAEAGPIFHTGFEGAGDDPSLNPDDYGEYFFGAGVGAPLADLLTVSLGYRFMRLNLRTPCPACADTMILNTDIVHSILLKLGLRFDW
jgi:hypothetical protein